MLEIVGKHIEDLSFLLGGWDSQTNPNREKWRPDLKAAGAVDQFVIGTDRFEEKTPERL